VALREIINKFYNLWLIVNHPKYMSVPIKNPIFTGDMDISGVSNLAEVGAILVAATGQGTVTSVNLSVPTGLSVSGGPITGSGTLAVTTTLSGMLKGNGSGFVVATPGTDYLSPTGSATVTNKIFTTGNAIGPATVFGGSVMALGSDAQGDIYYRANSGALTRLGIGSSGQILGVSSGVPQWQAPTVAAAFTSGTINGVVIGGVTPAAATFTPLTVKQSGGSGTGVFEVTGGFVTITTHASGFNLKDDSGVTQVSFNFDSNQISFLPDLACFGTINGITIVNNAGAGLSIGAGKTFTVSNTMQLIAADGSIIDLGGGGQVLYNGGDAVIEVLTAVDVSYSGIISMVPETMAGNGDLGALSLTQFVTTVQTTGAATAQLAAGATGLCKRINLNTDGGDLVVTVTNLQGGTTLTFSDAGDSVDLQYLLSKWQITSNNGVVVA